MSTFFRAQNNSCLFCGILFSFFNTLTEIFEHKLFFSQLEAVRDPAIRST